MIVPRHSVVYAVSTVQVCLCLNGLLGEKITQVPPVWEVEPYHTWFIGPIRICEPHVQYTWERMSGPESGGWYSSLLPISTSNRLA